MSWLRTRRAPSAGASYNTGASSQYSRPDPRPMVFDLLALLSRCCRASRPCFFFLAGGYSVPFTPGPSTVPQFLVHISGFCPGHEILALVRPVVPYTLALFSKRSRSVVSPAVRSTAALFADRWPRSRSYRRVALRLSKAPLSFTNLK